MESPEIEYVPMANEEKDKLQEEVVRGIRRHEMKQVCDVMISQDLIQMIDDDPLQDNQTAEKGTENNGDSHQRKINIFSGIAEGQQEIKILLKPYGYGKLKYDVSPDSIKQAPIPGADYGRFNEDIRNQKHGDHINHQIPRCKGPLNPHFISYIRYDSVHFYCSCSL